MAVQMPFGGFLFGHRLVRMCTSSQRHVRRRVKVGKLTNSRSKIRMFSTGSVKCDENKRAESDPTPLSNTLTPSQAPLARRRRPLSPLERISSLLPQDALSPDVTQLHNQQGADGLRDTEGSVTHLTHKHIKHPDTLTGDETIPSEDEVVEGHKPESCLSATLPGENVLMFGELLIAQYHNKGEVEFRKMFTLQRGTRLQSSWGVIPHDKIAGQQAGQFLRTHLGTPILIRRPSLEEYVLYMKRGPAIVYPKDAAIMLMMMDITEGDCVLESGSGSGAMSLFLSRAVGSKGSVLSVEVREDHLKRAVLNYNRWRTSWSLRRGEEWPDNVHFHNADLSKASSLLAGHGFNGIALDLINPYLVLPTVIPHLHPGGVCAVYLANITQVIDLLDAIRCMAHPLLCERIIEVPVLQWLVGPAMQKNGQYCRRKAPTLDENNKEEEEAATSDETDRGELATGKQPGFSSIPYIARPHPEQMSHTAFLIKLRKCVQ